MIDRPAPLVPTHVDLNGYEFLPLFGDRLFRSSFNRDATDAEFRAALNLWWNSWWETPAASLPNNDVDLCRMAGLKSIRRWRRVRDVAMQKWQLSSDDRWYHPVLASIACSVFESRKSASLKGRLGANKRWGINGDPNATAITPAIPNDSSGIAPAISKHSWGNSTGNSKLSEVNTPLTPQARSTSKPTAGSTSYANTQRLIAEQRAAEAFRAQLPPGLTKPSDLLAKVTRTTNPFDDEDPSAGAGAVT